MKLNLRIWRQNNADDRGGLKDYQLDGVSPDSSFLEMLDLLNEQLVHTGEEPVAFDHDCREGICGTCSLMINGVAHGKDREKAKPVTVCQLHMRHFSNGETLVIEPWRAGAFPVIRDLIVDRGSFDRIIQAGGYISVSTGSAPDANAMPISKEQADIAMDAASCIGCGACVAACPNAAAMLFTSAKLTHLNSLPQGEAERSKRVLNMVNTMDGEGFGGCTNMGECEAVCPKEISLDFIAQMNRDFIKATLSGTGNK
ncbi:MAG: succinate dehydrogenase/fumarate reductase iron-sulfur subunit [bacterium]|nr:succinate dehydrogenase/fumarate reductase iron-sulfur subunit [bacterium]